MIFFLSVGTSEMEVIPRMMAGSDSPESDGNLKLLLDATGDSVNTPETSSQWSGEWIQDWFATQGVADNGVAGPSNAGPSAQDPGEESSKRQRVGSGPDSGSGPQYRNVSSETEGRAAPEQRPLEITQDEVWEEVDKKKKTLQIKEDSDWMASWVTTCENQLGDLINKLRKAEGMRPLAPYRLQDVVESLENPYSMEELPNLIKDLQDKGTLSSVYKRSKIDNRSLPTEAVLKAAINDVTKGYLK